MLCSTGTPQSIWENIRSSSGKIQIQKPCIWQFTREDRNTVNLQTKRTNIELWFVPLLNSTNGDSLFPVKTLTRQLQLILILCSNPDLCPNQPTAHIASQDSLFGQFPGNSVISARPEMNAGRVDDGGFDVGGGTCLKNHLDGGLQLRLSGKGSASFLFSRRLLFSDPSVLTSQRTDARHAAIKTASGPAGENWAKLTTHILEHTQSHHKMTYRLYCSHLAFQ